MCVPLDGIALKHNLLILHLSSSPQLYFLEPGDRLGRFHGLLDNCALGELGPMKRVSLSLWNQDIVAEHISPLLFPQE